MNMLKKLLPIALFIFGIGTFSVLTSHQAGNLLSTATADDPVAVGKPCRVFDLASYNGGGTITDTHGLQCYAYGPASENRKGVWILPNQISVPLFLGSHYPDSLANLPRDWRIYKNLKSNYAFKYPRQWTVKKGTGDPTDSDPNVVTVFEAKKPFTEVPEQITITDHPNTKFESTQDYEKVKDLIDDWLTGFTFFQHFDLNGSPAMVVETMQNFSLGQDPYGVTVYVTRPNSYIEIGYTKYNDPGLDVPAEMLIHSLSLALKKG